MKIRSGEVLRECKQIKISEIKSQTLIFFILHRNPKDITSQESPSCLKMTPRNLLMTKHSMF